MDVEFVSQSITITIGSQTRTVDGIVGAGTDLACCPVPDGTVLKREFPNAWCLRAKRPDWINDSGIYHYCISTNPLPADEETAKLSLSKLHEQQIHTHFDAHDVILAMATAGIGNWVWISPSREEEDRA